MHHCIVPSLPLHPCPPKTFFLNKTSFFHKVFSHNCFCNSTPPIVEIIMIRKLFVFLLFRFPSPSIKYQVYQDFHLFLSEISTLHPSEISLSVYLRFPPAYFSEDIFYQNEMWVSVNKEGWEEGKWKDFHC